MLLPTFLIQNFVQVIILEGLRGANVAEFDVQSARDQLPSDNNSETLEAKLFAVDDHFDHVAAENRVANLKDVEDKMMEMEAQIEARLQQTYDEKLQRFKSTELSRVQLEAQAKFRDALAASRAEADATVAARLEQIVERETSAIARIKAAESESERQMFSQRQRIVQLMDQASAHEAEVKRESTLQTRLAAAQMEANRQTSEQLAMREASLAGMKEHYERKLEDGLAETRAKIRAQNEHKAADLAAREKRVDQQLASHEALIADVERSRTEVSRLQEELRARSEEIGEVRTTNVTLEDRLHAVRDYDLIVRQAAVTRQELVELRARTDDILVEKSELQNELITARVKVEGMARQLTQPSPEILELREQVQCLTAERNLLLSKLEHESNRVKDVQEMHSRDEKQLADGRQQLEDLRKLLQQTLQAAAYRGTSRTKAFDHFESRPTQLSSPGTMIFDEVRTRLHELNVNCVPSRKVETQSQDMHPTTVGSYHNKQRIFPPSHPSAMYPPSFTVPYISQSNFPASQPTDHQYLHYQQPHRQQEWEHTQEQRQQEQVCGGKQKEANQKTSCISESGVLSKSPKVHSSLIADHVISAGDVDHNHDEQLKDAVNSAGKAMHSIKGERSIHSIEGEGTAKCVSISEDKPNTVTKAPQFNTKELVASRKGLKESIAHNDSTKLDPYVHERGITENLKSSEPFLTEPNSSKGISSEVPVDAAPVALDCPIKFEVSPGDEVPLVDWKEQRRMAKESREREVANALEREQREMRSLQNAESVRQKKNAEAAAINLRNQERIARELREKQAEDDAIQQREKRREQEQEKLKQQMAAEAEFQAIKLAQEKANEDKAEQGLDRYMAEVLARRAADVPKATSTPVADGSQQRLNHPSLSGRSTPSLDGSISGGSLSLGTTEKTSSSPASVSGSFQVGSVSETSETGIERW